MRLGAGFSRREQDLNRLSQPIARQFKNGIDLQAAFADNVGERIAVQAKVLHSLYTGEMRRFLSLHCSILTTILHFAGITLAARS